MLVSHVVSRQKLAALFHDAAEAFIGDMSCPLKSLLPEYKKIEIRIESAIFAQFGIPWPPPAEVKAADLSVMAAELTLLMPEGTSLWLQDVDVIPAHVTIQQLAPTEAKSFFLRRYHELSRQA